MARWGWCTPPVPPSSSDPAQTPYSRGWASRGLPWAGEHGWWPHTTLAGDQNKQRWAGNCQRPKSAGLCCLAWEQWRPAQPEAELPAREVVTLDALRFIVEVIIWASTWELSHQCCSVEWGASNQQATSVGWRHGASWNAQLGLESTAASPVGRGVFSRRLGGAVSPVGWRQSDSVSLHRRGWHWRCSPWDGDWAAIWYWAPWGCLLSLWSC